MKIRTVVRQMALTLVQAGTIRYGGPQLFYSWRTCSYRPIRKKSRKPLDATESEVVTARALALAESFQRWHRYEFENTMLPLPLQSEMQQNQIVGSVRKVLPRTVQQCGGCGTLGRETINMDPTTPPSTSVIKQNRRFPKIPWNIVYSRRILNEPCPSRQELSSDTSNPSLVGIERLFQHTRTPVSPALWLLPKMTVVLFVLKRIGDPLRHRRKGSQVCTVSPFTRRPGKSNCRTPWRPCWKI
jgi:hypothetical protein